MAVQHALVERPDAEITEQGGVVQMFERLACDPNASVEKIERLMALWERAEARKAELAYNAAMSTAQAAMKAVAVDAYNPQTKSKYASYEALDTALRPVYTGHGFGLSFNTAEGAPDLHVRVVCKVTHLGGHHERFHVDMPADGKGAKGGDVMTRTHAVGSALSYGMRYLLKMIFNVAVGEDDDDGRKASTPTAEAPKGYDDWLIDMEAIADEGGGATPRRLDEVRLAFRNHITRTDPARWMAIKAKGVKAGAAK